MNGMVSTITLSFTIHQYSINSENLQIKFTTIYMHILTN
jgi:hypothetical protein